MVRILTTHRVFPAKMPGGNGIAGTSVVPSFRFKEYAHVSGGCNDFCLCIKRWDLGGFDDGVVVGPGLFEAVGEEFDRLGTTGTPDQKSGDCGTEAADDP